MNIRNNFHILIPDACTRTASVQIKNPATTATYIGKGELVITDLFGTPLTSTTAVKAVSTINIVHRSLDGSMHTVSVDGSDIKRFSGTKYAVERPLVHLVTLADSAAALTDHTFILRFTDAGTVTSSVFESSVSFYVDAAQTKAQIVTGLAAAINAKFDKRNDGTDFSATAAVVDTDKLLITAKAYDAPLTLNDVYVQGRYSVIATSFSAVITDNKTADLVVDVTTYPAATRGRGTAWEVVQNERRGRGFGQASHVPMVGVPYERSINYDAKIYEADGSTVMGYDSVTISWEKPRTFGVNNHTLAGQITLYLPTESNGTTQVGVATSGILAVLNKYIVTEHGVGTAFVRTGA